MSQYRIGTATFTQNSNVVTGQGTSWLGNVSAGNWIVRQGFGTTTYEAYQVASVASNTSLTLTAPYGGTTATAVAYVIAVDMLPNGIPELSNGDLETATIQNRANARLPAGLMGAAATLNTTSGPTGQANGLLWRTNDLVKQTNPTDAAAGRVMTVGAFGLGNAVVINGEDLDTMSVPGIYSITSLSGAANMPPSSQEGTLYVGGYAGGPTYRVTQLYIDLGGRMWVRSARNSWLAWRELYHTGNILGTVSQSGGVPTGALIQYGSNANGEFWRYQGGMQIVRKLGSLAAFKAAGSFYSISADSPPIDFINDPSYIFSNVMLYTSTARTKTLYSSAQSSFQQSNIVLINTGRSPNDVGPSFTALGSETAAVVDYEITMVGRWY
jgi:hypothetical protein